MRALWARADAYWREALCEARTFTSARRRDASDSEDPVCTASKGRVKASRLPVHVCQRVFRPGCVPPAPCIVQRGQVYYGAPCRGAKRAGDVVGRWRWWPSSSSISYARRSDATMLIPIQHVVSCFYIRRLFSRPLTTRPNPAVQPPLPYKLCHRRSASRSFLKKPQRSHHRPRPKHATAPGDW